MLTKKKPSISRQAPRTKKLAKDARHVQQEPTPTQSYGQLITSNLEENDAVYFYAPNFFANLSNYLHRCNAPKGWRVMFRISNEIKVLAKSLGFRNVLSDYQIREVYPREPHKNVRTEQRSLILIFAAMFNNPKNAYIKVYKDGDDVRFSWAGNNILFPEIAWDALCEEIYGYPAMLCTTDKNAPFNLMLSSGYQEISWRIFRMKNTFLSLNKTDEIKRQGSRERINNLSVGDRVIVPFSSVARLVSKRKGYTYLSLERGAMVYSRQKQTLKADDGLGDWTRSVEVVEDTSAHDFERASTVWEVLNVCWKGGGTGHGRHDVYPDGLHLTLRSAERKEIIEFYVSGAFTCQIDPELVIVE